MVAFMLYSVNMRIMNEAPNITIADCKTIFSNENSSFILAIIILALVVFLIYLLLSDFGLALRTTGYNKKFSSNVGINIKYTTVIGLVICNALIGLGGALFTQYQGFCDISQGIGTLVIGLTSVVIGEKLFTFKKEAFIIFSCVMGSILYRVFIGIALRIDFLSLKTHDLNLITGIIVILTMTLTTRSGMLQLSNIYIRNTLRGLNLSISEGKFVFIIGANEAGKTTLFNIISGCERPASGKVLINNKDITHLPQYKRVN